MPVDNAPAAALVTDDAFAAELTAMVSQWSRERPRTQQKTLGPSSLGACREYIRATLAGDPGIEERDRGIDAAFVGTAVGDAIEDIFAERFGARTQVPVTVEFTGLGLKVSGDVDAMFIDRNKVIDLKSCDGLAVIRYEGPKLAYLIQLAAYMIGAVQNGTLQEGCTGYLVYYDRRGKDKEFLAVPVTWESAQLLIQLAEDRLTDVFDVLDAGSPEESRWGLRDQSPALCHYLQCPYRDACWGGSSYRPTGAIEGEDELQRVLAYITAREDEKGIKVRKEAAKEDLRGIEGITPDGWIVTWNKNRLDVMPA